jgi:hypothetical protein
VASAKTPVRDAPQEPRSAGRGLRLTFDSLLVFVAVAMPAVVALRAAMPTIDLAYQIRAGQIMLDTGSILRTDLFTFTAFGRPWLNQQWGAQLLFAWLFRAGSWELIALARAAAVAVSFWLLYVACRARGAGARKAAWLCLGGLLVSIYGFVPRPQMFGFVLFALTLALLADRGRRPRRLWLVPVITLVWANLHGSFPLAPLVLLLAWAEDRSRRAPWTRTTTLAAVASIAAASVNPYGLRVWSYVVDLSTNADVRHAIEEWQPPRLLSPSGFVFFASVALVAVIAVGARRTLGWPRLVGLAIFFVIGATAIRGVIWWSLAAPVLIADLFPERAPRRERPSLVNTSLAVALVAIGLAFWPWFRPTFTSSADTGTSTDGLLSYAPNAYSTRVLQTVEPGTRLFVAEPWASWFEFVAPGYPIFVDPRIELFPSAIWDDYDAISDTAQGWERIVDRWGIDLLVLSQSQQSALIAVIADDPGWQVVYGDADGLLVVRAT